MSVPKVIPNLTREEFVATAASVDGPRVIPVTARMLADSQPDSEALETVNKSFAPLRAVWLADELSSPERGGDNASN